MILLYYYFSHSNIKLLWQSLSYCLLVKYDTVPKNHDKIALVTSVDQKEKSAYQIVNFADNAFNFLQCISNKKLSNIVK